MGRKKWYAVLAAVLCLTALWLLPDAGGAPEASEKYPIINHSTLVQQRDWQEKVITVRQDGRDLGTVDGELDSRNILYHLDHSKAVFLAFQRDQGPEPYAGDLYLVEKGEIVWITDQALDYCLALEGDGLAYMRQREPDNQRFVDLYLYRNGTRTLIAENIWRTPEGFQISPDGSCVAWMSLAAAYFYDGKAVTELGMSLTCQGISRGGGLVYLYQGSSDHIFVQKGGDTGSRVDLGEGFFSCFNRDLTEAVCTNRLRAGDSLDYQSFILKDGSQKHLLEHRIFSPALPMGTQAEGQVIGISSFADTYYREPEWYMLRLDGSFCTQRLPEQEKVVQSTLCADGKTLIYSTKDGVYRLDGSSPRARPQKLLNKEVRSCWVTGSGESVYYADRENRLYYRRGLLPPVLISKCMDALIPGVQNDTMLYTVAGADGACLVYAVKNGRSRLLTAAERGQYADWIPILRSHREAYGGVLRSLDDQNKIHYDFFDEPWNYDRLWAGETQPPLPPRGG